MKSALTIRRGAAVAAALFILAVPEARATSQTAALRIVVLEGEDAVNLIDKKTALKPTVEVRDRNDLPVAGVPVIFTIRGGRAAFANGSRTLTATTDSLGRATVSEMTPVGRGAVQIQAQATYQGQTATTTIHQMNFTNAADAAKGSGSGGATTTASAASGGLSNGVLAVIAGGAVAGTAGAATAISNRNAATSAAPFPVPIPETQGFAAVSATTPSSVTPTTQVDFTRCTLQGARFYWSWQVTFSETAGVAVTITDALFIVDGQAGGAGNVFNTEVPPRGSVTRPQSICSNFGEGGSVVMRYTGRDANGHSLTLVTPAIRLFDAPAALTAEPASVAPVTRLLIAR